MSSVIELLTPAKRAELLSKSARPGVEYNLTDLGNARRLVGLFGEDIRYCYAWGKWLIWNGSRWEKDGNGGIFRKAKDTVATIYSEAANAQDSEERKSLARHAASSESEARLRAMVSLAESEEGIPVKTDQLDADPWLLNCANGTVDLRTSELHPHQRENLITKIVPVEYAPAAECPAWIDFLQKIFSGNGNLITFIQKALGYSLTGSTREQIVFFLYGSGANGKSTLINIIMALMGDYALQTPAETFLQADRGNSIPNDIARLKGARFVAAVEAGEGRRLSEALIKQLAGGDTVAARFLHQEYFEFNPQCKIYFATNHKPRIAGTDHAIWRRVRLIPFNVTISEQEQDKDLPDKLRQELPGILAWAVRGCLGWQELGLGVPDEVAAATEYYRAEMDVIGGFIEDNCIVQPYAKVSIKQIYESYSKWCISAGEKLLSQRNFSGKLEEKGFIKDRGTGGYFFFKGIGLVE
jgi:putative DNA primase/helicase